MLTGQTSAVMVNFHANISRTIDPAKYVYFVAEALSLLNV